MCQLIPLFPNQLTIPSLYSLGKNVSAKTTAINASFVSVLSWLSPTQFLFFTVIDVNVK